MNDAMITRALWAYLEGGLSIVPINPKTKRPFAKLLPQAVDSDGRPLFYLKADDESLSVTTDDTGFPKGTWAPFQERQPTTEEAKRWLDNGIVSMAVVAGRVSGGVEILDFDAEGYYERWCAAVGDLADNLPVQQTGGGGIQVAWRCSDPEQNQKLAWHPDPSAHTGRTVAIETRGEGGYAVLPPSLHPSGNHYKLLRGRFSDIPHIAMSLRNYLLSCARQLCQAPKTKQDLEREALQEAEKEERRRNYDGDSVIDAYNAKHGIEAVLTHYGYTKAHGGRWSRPGDTDSAGVEVIKGQNKTYHYSSNDPLDSDSHGDHQPRAPFDYLLHFDHRGDYKAAVKAAALEMGMAKPAVYTNGANGYVKSTTAKHGTDSVKIECCSYETLLANMRAKAMDTYDDRLAINCLSDTEEGDARLLHNIVVGRVVYDHAEGQWYWYNNLYWEPDKTWNIYQLTSDVLSEVYKQLSIQKHAEALELEKALYAADEPTQEQRDKLKKTNSISKTARHRAGKLNEINEVKRVLSFASSGLRLGITGDEWDTKVTLLCMQNVIIDLTNGKPVQPKPESYIRTTAPIRFDPDAKCPQWDKAILEIFDNSQNDVDYVHRLLGYAMSGECVESDFPIWYGKDGRNGKEFILERIRNVLGEKLAGVAESELLLASKTQRGKNSSTEGLMALRGRRIAWASETNEGRQLDLAAMKDLSGGHVLTGRHNHGRQVEWKRTHTLILLTNHRPHVNSQALAEWDRVKLLEFPLSFVNEPDPAKPNQRKKDKTLGDRIDQEELPGIFNRLLAGNLLWRAIGLCEPESVKSATAKYRQDEDTLGHFVLENCYVSPEARCKPIELYRKYVEWIDIGSKPMGKKTFYTKIEERGFRRSESMGYEHFFGIGILSV